MSPEYSTRAEQLSNLPSVGGYYLAPRLASNGLNEPQVKEAKGKRTWEKYP